ncbi:MAG: phosphoenolpyruvate--protein phosphotransferase [Tepidisphaeraceae bacterium]
MLDFSSDNVLLNVRVRTKDEAIERLGALLADNGYIDLAYGQSMLARERVANTYLGKGIAIPHGLPKDRQMIRKTGLAVLQVPDGVEWLPGDRAKIIVGIAAKSDEHLEILGNLTDLLYHDDLVDRLARTRDAEDIVAALTASREEAQLPGNGQAAAQDYAKHVDVAIAGSHGLHARPATAFIEVAKQFNADVLVRYGAKVANGKSLAALLKLGVSHGATVRISAQGAEADAALAALTKLIEAGEEEEATLAGPSHGWTPSGGGLTLPGVAASNGLAIGPIRKLSRAVITFERTAQDPAAERASLKEAIFVAQAQLHELHEHVSRQNGTASAAIFLAHGEFLNDAALLALANERIDTGLSAAAAWSEAIEAEAAALSKVEDPLLAARAVDLRDVGQRVLRVLTGTPEPQPITANASPSILLADDLAPSDVAGLDVSVVLGFCTVGGGPTSHVAIIARSMNLPAVVGAGPSVLELSDGDLAILDGDNGALYVHPTEADVKSAEAARRKLSDVRAQEAEHRFEPAILTDGTRVEVVANIGTPQEAAQAIEAGGEGVGLLRSEFLFLDRQTAPSEDEQYAAYRQMAESLGGLPLIIRTLDIGGDKPVPYLNLAHEDNPFLGLRGIRLCLAMPDVFKTQLRAIFRAAAHGSVKIMFPMIATLVDLRAAKLIVEQVRSELHAEPVEVGIMIEVPSAVVMAAELAREVDFFSVGTNDLTQYVLAMDRGHPLLGKQADALHPAVLRMIDQTVKAAVAAGKWVGVCGGVASDPLGAAILTGLGVAELSVSIPSIPTVKAGLRALSMAHAKHLAERALACGTAEEVRKLPLVGRKESK